MTDSLPTADSPGSDPDLFIAPSIRRNSDEDNHTGEHSVESTAGDMSSDGQASELERIDPRASENSDIIENVQIELEVGDEHTHIEDLAESELVFEPELIETNSESSVESQSDLLQPSSQNRGNSVEAQLIAEADPIAPAAHTSQTATTLPSPPRLSPQRSWVFSTINFASTTIQRVFGLASLVGILSFIASVPILQFLSLGYFFEAQGRIGRSGKVADGLFGLDKAARLGSIIMGTWLLLLPIRLLSGFWYQAQLVDPTSTNSALLRFAQFFVAGLLIANILAAWFCGGRLRYFFWPFVAPVSFAIWIARKLVTEPSLKPIFESCLGWVSPHLVNDIGRVPPITDWFLPAIVLKSLFRGTLFSKARDGVWDFAANLRLKHFFWLGLRGFAGTIIWLFVPTLLLVMATMTENVVAAITGLLGVALSTMVYMVVPFLQASFATDNRFSSMFNLYRVYDAYRRAPIFHWMSLFLLLLFAIPLFLLKIEKIPTDLMWMLSLVFIVFSLPARIVVGWAFGVGRNRPKKSWRIVRYPVLLMGPPITLLFTIIFFFTQYTSWNGGMSLFEHHAFLLPVPFWIGQFL